MERGVALTTFTPSRPRRVLAVLACAPGILAAAFVLATLVLLALDGHPEGLLAAAAGAVIPVVLWGAWRLTQFVPSIRSITGSRLAGDDVTAPMTGQQPEREATIGPAGTGETQQSARLSTEPRETKAVEAAQAGDLVEAVHRFNAENAQHEALWTRVQHSSIEVRSAIRDADRAAAEAQAARLAHRVIQAENPGRRAPRPRQLALAGITVALDAVGCYFAAQALGNGQLQTVGWTALFLAVLVGGQLALDHYGNRHLRLWRALAVGLSGFVAGLGVLRYSFLISVGVDSLLAALVGAALFTAAIAVFVAAGYWSLRRAETSAASRARRRARRAAKEAAATREQADRRLRQRDRLVDAYIVRIKAGLLQSIPASRLPQAEAALRALLSGEPTAGATHPWLRPDQESKRGPADTG